MCYVPTKFSRFCMLDKQDCLQLLGFLPEQSKANIRRFIQQGANWNEKSEDRRFWYPYTINKRPFTTNSCLNYCADDKKNLIFCLFFQKSRIFAAK